MIIKKNGTLSRVLKEVLKRSKTGNVSTLLNSFQFEKGKGITIFFSEAIDTILIKDESVDFNANITNDFIVVALASELEKNDVSISIDSSSNVVFNEYTFKNVGFNNYTEGKRSPFISFSQEQFQNLEKDFELTVGNYFKLPKATDVICLAFKEGKLYKLLPGCNVYEISKFDGTIDAVELEKVSGHSTFICIMPHKIFDLMKNEYNVSISYSSDNNRFYFESSEILICLRFSFSQLGAKVFINNLSIINDNESIATLKSFLVLKEKIKSISSNLFEEVESPNIFVNVENNKINLNIEDISLSFDTDLKENITFNVDLLAFNYILQNLPENTTISKDKYFLIFKTENKTIFIINKEI